MMFSHVDTLKKREREEEGNGWAVRPVDMCKTVTGTMICQLYIICT